MRVHTRFIIVMVVGRIPLQISTEDPDFRASLMFVHCLEYCCIHLCMIVVLMFLNKGAGWGSVFVPYKFRILKFNFNQFKDLYC